MKTESDLIVFSAEQEIVDVKPGIRRQLLAYTSEVMPVHVFFGPDTVGKRPPLHHHPHVQVTYILSGKFEAHIEDTVKIVGPGDSYRVPSNVPHEIYCIEPGDVIDVFTPFRQEFITS